MEHATFVDIFRKVQFFSNSACDVLHVIKGYSAIPVTRLSSPKPLQYCRNGLSIFGIIILCYVPTMFLFPLRLGFRSFSFAELL